MDSEVTYNLFRHGRDPAIVCAVPNDKPVPRFIRSPAWIFESTIALGAEPSDGFEPGLAEVAANANGFYLFVAADRTRLAAGVVTTEMRAAA